MSVSINLQYEIFKCEPDGSIKWLDCAPDLANARVLLQKFAKSIDNDCFAMCVATRDLVFRADGSRSEPVLTNRVFEIAYNEELRNVRADLMRSRGYGVLSVMGNDAAKTLLRTVEILSEEITFFMVGHAAPKSTRNEMIDWLRAHYPSVRIIALNPPNEEIPTADYNVLQNGPELWLPIVTGAAGTAP